MASTSDYQYHTPHLSEVLTHCILCMVDPDSCIDANGYPDPSTFQECIEFLQQLQADSVAYRTERPPVQLQHPKLGPAFQP